MSALHIHENEPLRPKTTMRIGGSARYYAEPATKEDVERAADFAREKNIPLVVLGGGSNTIFADGPIDALIIRIPGTQTTIDGDLVTVESGKNLPSLINELAKEGLDLSPLTGILGTVGGAVFGNAGQGPKGIWIDAFVESVMYYHEKEWHTRTKAECDFRYRESWFKDQTLRPTPYALSPIIWETTLSIPRGNPATIQTEIQRLLQRRIETQPHVKTAGSCFKAVGNTPAWQLIDAVGLRGAREGGVVISEKHANFLINDKEGSFADAVAIVEKVKAAVSEPLNVEMRFINPKGTTEF
ncbi:UDP-N-acetylmuramate dehydrogenase [Candidatus Peregrinibacteria bacterium]|nr:UDP-N-acetylmuramate dehydrogenase [Candidatus Peregrinibacteria bacterium]